MAKVRKKGMSAWYATDGTSWTALAVGASPASPWVQITDVNTIKPVPFTAEKYDDSNLEDLAEELAEEHKAGTVDLEKDVNDESVTLDGFVKNSTKKAFAVVYKNGTARYNSSCRFYPKTGGDGEKQDFRNAATESFTIQALSGKFELQAATP